MLFIMVYFAPLCRSILFSICFDFPMLHSHRPSSSFSAVSFPLFFLSLLYSYSRFLTLWLLTQFKMIKSIDIYLLRVFSSCFFLFPPFPAWVQRWVFSNICINIFNSQRCRTQWKVAIFRAFLARNDTNLNNNNFTRKKRNRTCPWQITNATFFPSLSLSRTLPRS